MRAADSLILEEHMLSFELSAMDLILAVAVIILLILYLTKSSAKPPVEEKLLVESDTSSREPVMEATLRETAVAEAMIREEETERTVSSQLRSQIGSATCSFGFGYLRKLDKQASIPDECLGCPRIMECGSANE